MTLSKNAVRVLIFAVIAIVVFNVVSFAAPFTKAGVFWVSYGFGMAAILMQLIVMKLAFDGTENVRSKFYGFPIARIGLIYGFCQIVLSVAAMAIGQFIPTWIPVVVFVLILAAAAAGMISADAVRDEVQHQDEKIIKDVSRMRDLQSKMNVLISQSDVSDELGSELEKLAENIKYSDPVSGRATEQIEDELNFNIEELQKAIVDGDEKSSLAICKKTNGVLAERNRLCKLNKNSK